VGLVEVVLSGQIRFWLDHVLVDVSRSHIQVILGSIVD